MTHLFRHRTRHLAAALLLLPGFRDRVATSDADMLIDLGDRISNADHDTDAGLMREVMAVFEPMAIPRAHLLGNHDRHYLSRAENEAILGRPLGSRSLDVNGWHLVFWQIDLSGRFPDKPIPAEADFDWLRADLAGTTLPAVVFTHVPLDGSSMTGNYYFQNNPASATLRHTAQARQVIEAAGNVVLCVAGHVHWNNATSIDGIRYLTVQSLAESFTTEGEPTGAWAEIELSDRLLWRVHGADPVTRQAIGLGEGIEMDKCVIPIGLLEQGVGRAVATVEIAIGFVHDQRDAMAARKFVESQNQS